MKPGDHKVLIRIGTTYWHVLNTSQEKFVNMSLEDAQEYATRFCDTFDTAIVQVVELDDADRKSKLPIKRG
jgi:hypothetical protein